MEVEPGSDDSSDSEDEEVSHAGSSLKFWGVPTDLGLYEQKEEEFYTPGSEELLVARRKIADFSLKR
jgi:hypothetical protein